MVTTSNITNAQDPYGLASLKPAVNPTIDFTGLPQLKEGVIPQIGMTAPTSGGYDMSQDAYAQAALKTLGEQQGLAGEQFTETLRNMGLRGAGTVAPLTQEFLGKQTTEKALLGGQLAENARTGALNEAQVTGYLGSNATLAREQASVNAAAQAAGIDLNRYQAGVSTEMEKERLTQSAKQLGLSEQQINSQIALNQAQFNEGIRQADRTFEQGLKDKDQQSLVSSMAASVGMGLSSLGESEASEVMRAVNSGSAGSLGGKSLEAYNMIMDKINSAPVEYRESLIAAAGVGFQQAVQKDIGAVDWVALAAGILGEATSKAVGKVV
jgi:hypothetical protein